MFCWEIEQVSVTRGLGSGHKGIRSAVVGDKMQKWGGRGGDATKRERALPDARRERWMVFTGGGGAVNSMCFT